jgi:predicted aspartyl protease
LDETKFEYQMKHIGFALFFAIAFVSVKAETITTVPMQDTGSSVFYVMVKVKGAGKMKFLVDTGAGYMTINENTLTTLRNKGLATYVKDLEGVLADGSLMIVPVYKIASINIGGACEIRNVEAAVFPGATRGLLGLSALQRTAPFVFSVEPPALQLSNCINVAVVTTY